MAWSRLEIPRKLRRVGFQRSGISPRAPCRMLLALACLVDCCLTAVLDTEDWPQWYAIRPGRRVARDRHRRAALPMADSSSSGTLRCTLASPERWTRSSGGRDSDGRQHRAGVAGWRQRDRRPAVPRRQAADHPPARTTRRGCSRTTPVACRRRPTWSATGSRRRAGRSRPAKRPGLLTVRSETRCTGRRERWGAFPISRSRAHTHRRHGHPLQTVPSAGLIERPQEKNRVDALR